MKKITIVSGKGGVGKSMLASSLAVLLSRDVRIVVADCDVDAPDLGLSLGLEDTGYDSWEEITTNEKAFLIDERCTGCGKCANVCAFGALTWDARARKPAFSRLFCEGCGACGLVCPEKAIGLAEVKNASVGTGRTQYGFPIVSGQLRMGESGSGKVIFIVKSRAEALASKDGADVVLIDAAAGIGCPVISSIRGSDYVIAVTEPTPSALNDVKRALQIVRYFGIPCGLVINKYDLNKDFSGRIERFAKRSGIRVLGKIPYDRRFVDALVSLKPVVVYERGFEPVFSGILRNVMDSLAGAGAAAKGESGRKLRKKP